MHKEQGALFYKQPFGVVFLYIEIIKPDKEGAKNGKQL